MTPHVQPYINHLPPVLLPPPVSSDQVYFRYPSPAVNDGDQRSVSHQLVQCVYKKTSYPSPIQVQPLPHLDR